jgi:hypothetical protein
MPGYHRPGNRLGLPVFRWTAAGDHRNEGHLDYGKWRPAFDSHSAMQKAAGLSNPRVLRSADDKNEIVIIFDTTDTKKAKEFATSSDLKDVMTKAGVIDVPTMYFLESI